MLMTDLIHKKRIGEDLNEQEIAWMIESYMQGNIPDYQMSAFLMAVCFQGMDDRETFALTKAMYLSGDTLDLSDVPGWKVDKHSTGGVGDKTTLVLAPLLASAGVTVAKMSGRGLGHTGGTLDKLEAIPGFRIQLDEAEFKDQLKKIHIAIIGQSQSLAPADKRLYALRDVTDTVNSIPLIASSIMSKKLACQTDAILLDVKYGLGAFMPDRESARKLADTMIAIGEAFDRKVDAVLSSMDEPLGLAIGNALEVKEAIATLKGRGPKDLTSLCLNSGARLLTMCEPTMTTKAAYRLLSEKLLSGEAFSIFRSMVEAQGGDTAYIDHPELFPKTRYHIHLKTKEAGYIESINSYQLGISAMHLGAGRQKQEDPIDPSVGLVLKAKVSDYVNVGDPLLTIYANNLPTETFYQDLWQSFVLKKGGNS